MKRRVFVTAFFFLVFLCGMAAAEEYGTEISASVDHATVLIGDRIKFTVYIEHLRNVEINFPKFKEDKIGDFEIKDSGYRDEQKLVGGVLMRRWYYLAAYSPGKHQIPPVEIKYRKKGDKDWKVAKTKALNIIVESVLPKGKTLADIKDVKGPLGYFEINWFIVAGVLVIGVIMALIVLYKFRKKPLPLKLPYEIALEELEAVRGNFLKTSDVKEYYAGVSDCVRRYIERSFRLKAPEMTTEEFLTSLGASQVLSYERKDLLKDFLSACDLVKFAKYMPAKGEMEAVFLAAKKFIEETRGR
ncbi:MAG: BatD family protein [Candidatus Omnitrophica bacterium]|nr:BatD family protein [Candidatus Omnitrophota bacterium]MDD5436065.1 BatD family protein [Candidatus Omnitrophota bacterium]